MELTISGTGTMARGIASRLLAGGHAVTLLGTEREKAETLAGEFPRVCPVGPQASRPKMRKGPLCRPFRGVSDGTRTRGRRDHNPHQRVCLRRIRRSQAI